MARIITKRFAYCPAGALTPVDAGGLGQPVPADLPEEYLAGLEKDGYISGDDQSAVPVTPYMPHPTPKLETAAAPAAPSAAAPAAPAPVAPVAPPAPSGGRPEWLPEDWDKQDAPTVRGYADKLGIENSNKDMAIAGIRAKLAEG